MQGNTFGRVFRITTAGESYAGAFRRELVENQELQGGLVVIVDGVQPGIKLTSEIIQEELSKRRPGQSKIDTPRKESDKAYILTGVMENQQTTGAPVTIYIPNRDIPPEHLEKHRSFKSTIRPGQAALTYHEKYGDFSDWAGAGRASGRETAARVAGGAVAKAILDSYGIEVMAYTVELHGIKAKPMSFEEAKANYRSNDINCPDMDAAQLMIDDLLQVNKTGDTCGGIIEIVAKGVPAGLGEPVFDKLEAMLAHGLMSLGAVKGIEFGEGFELVRKTGSESNDTPYIDEKTGKIHHLTNRAGGILGGISNGEEIRIRVAVKPTPTIAKTQKTIDIEKMENIEVSYTTRNDPSIIPRIYSVCEAMVRIVLVDALYMARGYGQKL